MLISVGIGHAFCTSILVHVKTDRHHARVIHSAVLLFPFTVFSRMVVVLWQIAFYSYVSFHLAFSRKYGTVWYYPASSKLWYLTTLSFVNFQEKLTGTSFALCACEASFVRLAV
jgi:hypothetical protein